MRKLCEGENHCHSTMANWRGKMAQRRSFWAVVAVSLLFLCLLSWASIANLGGRVYCDYLKGEYCQVVPSPSPHLDSSFPVLQPAPFTTSKPVSIPILPPVRNYSDGELSTFVLAKDILTRPLNHAGKTKVAFMFLTGGPLPFEKLWEKFFKGHEDRYSVYVHASQEQPTRKSRVFQGRDIRPQKVFWGRIEMVDAERRLLANALLDSDNQYFVLLSESCIPLYDFDYIYDYLLSGNMSYVDCFDDPGPHGQGRYMDQMMPEIRRSDWRKGAQWFAVTRHHALLIVADHVYYNKFKWNCKPGEENRNCYPDEHYISTFLYIMNPANLANWTVTHVDWSEGKWHPKSYTKEDVKSPSKLQQIQKIKEHFHVTSDGRAIRTVKPCLWNGQHRPCFLFARKFLPETADALLQLLPSVTWRQAHQPA
ncbi:hypothetical protein M758_10G093800 [Ceratodon purpureus]|nr:hypothetical protein M758_10G093800 [Ceratodon purpureus]